MSEQHSQHTNRYILTARYAITVTDTQLAALREYYTLERDLATGPGNEDNVLPLVNVLADTVEEFHVGNNTDIVREIDIFVEDHEGKFIWED
jgi:hypothetical protein